MKRSPSKKSGRMPAKRAKGASASRDASLDAAELARLNARVTELENEVADVTKMIVELAGRLARFHRVLKGAGKNG